MSTNLPVKQGDNFLAEVETMDLGPLKDKSFLVGVSQGDRNKVKTISSTIHGPYNFSEMVEEVGFMWEKHQHHAKVIILDKDRNSGVKSLDENTIDYIEAFHQDIIAESMLEGAFDDLKEFTCIAGINDSTGDPEDPRNHVQEAIASTTKQPALMPGQEEDDL